MAVGEQHKNDESREEGLWFNLFEVQSVASDVSLSL